MKESGLLLFETNPEITSIGLDRVVPEVVYSRDHGAAAGLGGLTLQAAHFNGDNVVVGTDEIIRVLRAHGQDGPADWWRMYRVHLPGDDPKKGLFVWLDAKDGMLFDYTTPYVDAE